MPMKKRARPVAARFMLVQPDGEARTWSDTEIKRVLEDFLKIWADTVDGEVDRLEITIDGSEPTV